MALLWRAQKQNGYWLPRAAIEKVAAMLDMPNIRVLEVATFYTMFNLAPVGRHYVQVCTDDAVHAGRLGRHQGRLPQTHRRTGPCKFGRGVFLIQVECLGACCNAPMVQINDDYYEDLTPENFAKLLDNLAAGLLSRLARRPDAFRLSRLAA